jgi:hypothetical protein
VAEPALVNVAGRQGQPAGGQVAGQGAEGKSGA